MSLVLDFLPFGVFISTMVLTLFIFQFMDQLIIEVKLRNRLFRFVLAAVNGALVVCAISFYERLDSLSPTAFLVLFLAVCYVIEYAIMSKDKVVSYFFLGSAVFFNYLMVYVLMYSVSRLILYDSVSSVQYQSVVLIFANLICVGIIILYRLPFFPVKELKRIIHSPESLLLNIWFPMVSGITFLNTIFILPGMEGVWTSQNEWLNHERAVAFYVIIMEWASLLMSSSYLVVFYQAGKIGAKNEVRETREEADRQPLTGLLNRRAWEREVKGALAAGKRGYLVMLDLDHFKEVNDNLGHQEGDRILKEMAEMLRQTFREVDIIGHIGGDEFCVFLVGDFEKEVVDQRMEYLMRLRRKEFPSKNGGTFTLSLSAGYAAVSDHGTSLENLVAAADAALYWQKEHGRDGFARWNEEMEKS